MNVPVPLTMSETEAEVELEQEHFRTGNYPMTRVEGAAEVEQSMNKKEVGRKVEVQELAGF